MEIDLDKDDLELLISNMEHLCCEFGDIEDYYLLDKLKNALTVNDE